MQFNNKENVWAGERKEFQKGHFENPNESVWWERFKKGDKNAFDYIYYTYRQQLYNYGCHLCSDEGLVRDCIHDLFITLISNKARLGQTDSIKFYLLKAFKRRLLKSLQKRGNAKKREGIFSDENFRVCISDESVSFNNVIPGEIKTVIQQAVNKLPASQREAVILFYYEGLSYREIKDLMNLGNVKSARTLIYRAVASLTKKLKPIYKVLTQPVILLLQLVLMHE